MITTEPRGIGIVNVDWFALSCHLTRDWKDVIVTPPKGCTAVRLTCTAVWAERWYILTSDGNKLCTILACPRSWKIAPDRCMIEVANRWLYYEDFEQVLDAILECIPVVVDGLNRVDLCCDFEMDVRTWRTYQMMADGSAYVGAYKTGVVWWRGLSNAFVPAQSLPLVERNNGRVAHQLSFGGKDSTLHWKVYYKALELAEAEPDAKKDYIREQWERAGMDVRCVWRCEVSIAGSKALESLSDGRPIPPREWYRQRADLWKSLYVSRFVVRRAEGHKDRRNDEKLTFIDVDGWKMLRTARPKSTRDASDPERRLLSKLWDEFREVDVSANATLHEMLRDNIIRLCERADNWLHLRRMAQMTEQELMQVLEV